MTMTLWVLQMIFNLFLGLMTVLWFVSRKKINWLEAQLEMIAQEQAKPLTPKQPVKLEHNQEFKIEPEVKSVVAKSATANANPSSNLQERRVEPHAARPYRPNPEAYDRAEILISKGMNLSEVSRQTGLSVAELQLMNKVSTRLQ